MCSSDLIIKITEKHQIRSDRVFETVFVANPIMHHLLLGIDPKELGQAPFPLVFSEYPKANPNTTKSNVRVGLILNVGPFKPRTIIPS